MSNKKREEIVLKPGEAPERKCSITPVAMAEYVKNHAPEDNNWFTKLCDDNPKNDNTYGINVKAVREAFIEKYYKGAYEKEKQSQKTRFDKLLSSMR